MPKLLHTQNSFSSGELSPILKGRTSLAQYDNGCEQLENFIVLPQGGVTKRPGTEFIREVKHSANTTTLLPFVVGSEQSYILELGNYYMRFYRDGGILLSTAAITNGTFTSDLTGWTDIDTGTGASTYSSGTMLLNGGSSGVAARTQKVEYLGVSQYTLTFTVSTNSCTYKIGTTSGGSEITSGTAAVGTHNITFTPTTAGSIYVTFSNSSNTNSNVDSVSLDTPIYELDTPWSEDQVEAVQWAQSKDTMYMAHGDVALRKLRRFGASHWDLVAVDLVDGPYYNKTDSEYGGVGTGITITPSATTGTITVTASAAIFVSTDVGRALRYRSNSTSEWAEISLTAYTSSTVMTGIVEKVLSGTTASDEWRLGYFSDTTGHPSCVTFHEQRLVLGNTRDRPQSIWFSRAGDIEVFQPDNDSYKDEVDATSAITYTVSSRNTNSIVWLSSRDKLYLGTANAIFIAKASSLDEAITPDNVSIKPAILTAAYTAMPIETTAATLFIHYNQRKLVELAYDVQRDSQVGVDLTILSEQVAYNKFKRIARQEEPYNLLWTIDEQGGLHALTYLRDQQVVGWHTHKIGGTDVEVTSVACIPGETESEVWFIVRRTIDGSSVQYIERLSSFFRDDVAPEDAVFVDSALTYNGTATTSISGLSHLEGETVAGLSDGYVAVVEDAVTSGAVTLQEGASKIHLGLPYTCKLKTMPIDMQGPGGSIHGSLVRALKSVVRFHRSALARVGYSTADSNIVENFGDNYVMGGAVPLFSGLKEIPYDHGTELEIASYIEQDKPTPVTVLTVATRLLVDDDR